MLHIRRLIEESAWILSSYDWLLVQLSFRTPLGSSCNNRWCLLLHGQLNGPKRHYPLTCSSPKHLKYKRDFLTKSTNWGIRNETNWPHYSNSCLPVHTSSSLITDDRWWDSNANCINFANLLITWLTLFPTNVKTSENFSAISSYIEAPNFT